MCLLAQLFVFLENWKWDPKRNIKRKKKWRRRQSLFLPIIPLGGNLRLPILAFYLNIKGEVDPQRHIVKPVTPITKAVKWAEDGRGRARGSARMEEGDEGPGATAGNANRVRAGDCEAVAGKVTVRRAIIILWAAADTSRGTGRVEGNRIDRPESWRMLGSDAAGEARKPWGSVGTLAGSSEAQPLTLTFFYLFIRQSVCAQCNIRPVRYRKCNWH